MRSMSIVAVRASLASVSSRVDDRRMRARINPIRIHSHPCACVHALHSRARWAWTTMYTHSDSIHSTTKHRCIRFVPHRPCMFYKTCMNDRFVPRIETQYVHTPPWSGSVDTHDGHTHTHSSLFHSIRIYCPRSTPYTKYKRARPRHAVNQSRMARIRRRDVARETGDERATTTWENERTNAFVVVSDSDETGRDRESFTRESSVSGKSIGRERRKSQRARNSFTHSLIHSVR